MKCHKTKKWRRISKRRRKLFKDYPANRKKIDKYNRLMDVMEMKELKKPMALFFIAVDKAVAKRKTFEPVVIL